MRATPPLLDDSPRWVGFVTPTALCCAPASLAAFLIGTGPGSLYGCCPWSVNGLKYFPEYDKPLGPPQGLAVYDAPTETWHRSFGEAGRTKVSFCVRTNVGHIEWGTALASAPASAPALKVDDDASWLPKRPSRGRGRDVSLAALQAGGPCLEPPPPLMPDSVAAPPSHLKYLSLDGFGGDEETDGWANLAFLGLQGPSNGQSQWKGVNETQLQRNLDKGYDMLIDVRATQ